jgi:long-chain acyl-CoA synthetase
VEPLLSQLEGIHSAGHALVRSEAEALTLSCLAERSRALSALIERLGLRVVALHMDNRPDWLVIDLACQLASVCLVPLPTFFSEEQLRHVLDSIPVDGIFTDRSDLVAPWCAGRIRPTPELAVGAFELLRLDPPPDAGALPDGTGKVTFTSGSTGRPKGVCLGDAQLLAQAAALATAVDLDRPRHLCLLPLSTLLENIAGLYAPLLAGGEVMIPTLAEVGFEGSSTLNPQVLLNLLTRHRPNSLILTPQLLQILVAAARNGWMPPSELRFVAVGGAKVPGGLLEAAHVLGIPAFEGYGLSECASVVSLNLPGSNRPGSCGKPLPQLQVEIVDGEICVSGNAMLGYAGEPHSWGQGRIASGDLGYLDDDGFLVINGRRKNLLISSFGRNISPEWVESEALASGTLAECVVFGDARPFCVALISPRDPQACDETIQQSLDRSNAHLPDYARIRRWFRLPSRLADCAQMLTQNGRPRRQAIATRFDETIDGLYSGHSLTDGPFARTA